MSCGCGNNDNSQPDVLVYTKVNSLIEIDMDSTFEANNKKLLKFIKATEFYNKIKMIQDFVISSNFSEMKLTNISDAHKMLLNYGKQILGENRVAIFSNVGDIGDQSFRNSLTVRERLFIKYVDLKKQYGVFRLGRIVIMYVGSVLATGTQPDNCSEVYAMNSDDTFSSPNCGTQTVTFPSSSISDQDLSLTHYEQPIGGNTADPVDEDEQPIGGDTIKPPPKPVNEEPLY